ncbi:MAG: threonine/serine exporter family protein [Agathobacter rectalis]
MYSPARLGLAAAIACCAFTFLLGGGPIEMILAFVAAGIGNLIRTKLIKHHFTLFLNSGINFCLMLHICGILKIAEMAFNVPSIHEAGYICSMLFIIRDFVYYKRNRPGKAGSSLGLERLAYAIIIIVATMFAWIMALLLRLQPMDFEDLNLTPYYI